MFYSLPENTPIETTDRFTIHTTFVFTLAPSPETQSHSLALLIGNSFYFYNSMNVTNPKYDL